MIKIIRIVSFLVIFLFTLFPSSLKAATLSDVEASGEIISLGQTDKEYNDTLSLLKGRVIKQYDQKQQLDQKENEKRKLENTNGIQNKILVKFNISVPIEQITQLLSKYKYKAIGKKDNFTFSVDIDNIEDFKESAGQMVEWIEEDSEKKVNILPNDTHLSSQWAVNAVALPQAWDVTTGSSDVYVAVIDSGINRYHPDFQNARICNGWDLIYEDAVSWDSIGHGTEVTGIIAASPNNGRGIAGVDWKVSIVPFRVVYYDGTIYTSDVVQAIYLAADSGCKVINLSLGGSSYSNSENSAIQYAVSKGCIVVAAAGNDGNSIVNYPASYPNVISVGSVNQSENHSYFSNYNRYVDVSAPGEHILSTTNNYSSDSYDFVDGTSFSAPYVSGIAGLVVATAPNITPAEFQNAIATTSSDLGSLGYDYYYGYGLINAGRLLTYLTKLSTPVGFNISSSSDRQVTLNWMPNNESNLAGYQLEYKTAAATTWSILNVGKTVNSYKVINLLNGTNYQFRLKAKDTAGNCSDYTDVLAEVPVDNVAPPAPTGLKVNSVNEKQVSLGWVAVTEADLAGYQLEYKGANDADWTVVPIGKVTTYTLTGLTNEVAYSFQIKAKDTSNNLSTASSVVSGTPVDKLPPAVPTGLKVPLIGTENSITLSWNTNPEEDLGGYEIAYQQYRTTTWMSQAVEPGATSVTIEGLAQNVKFTFKIRAKDLKDNWSNYSTTVTAIPKDQVAPAKPTGLTAQPSDRSMILTWEANTEVDLAGYQLEYKKEAAKSWSIISIGKTLNSYKVMKLVNGTNYQFRLKAKDAAKNCSDSTDVLTEVPMDNVAPPIPEGLKVNLVKDKQVTLGWTAVKATDLAGYQIEYKGANDADWTAVSVGKAKTYTLTGLTNEELYSFQIKAKDTSNNLSTESNQVSETPVDRIPPAVPTGLKVTLVGANNNVTLSWKANSEADLGGYEIAYQQYRTTSWMNQAVEPGATSVTIEGLVHNVKFTFKIRANDQKDNWSNYSRTVTAIPKD